MKNKQLLEVEQCFSTLTFLESIDIDSVLDSSDEPKFGDSWAVKYLWFSYKNGKHPC